MITLITDFGLADPYVGIMKGVMLSIDPCAVIVDLTHAVDPQDIAGAAYAIDGAYRFFPEGTLHVVVVDPGVGSDRRILCVSVRGHLFLVPDNGVLTRVMASARPDAVFRVENKGFFRSPVSRTFHGRDIFAPVAGHINKGVPIHRLGREISVQEMHSLALPVPKISRDGQITGEVIRVDGFGNLITNIDDALIRKIRGCAGNREGGPDVCKDVCVTIGKRRIHGLADSYQQVSSGSLLAIIGSSGFVEISVNLGSAARLCNAGRGTAIQVSPG